MDPIVEHAAQPMPGRQATTSLTRGFEACAFPKLVRTFEYACVFERSFKITNEYMKSRADQETKGS